MVFCKLAEFLYDVIPLAGFRDLLLRVHMEGCPRCERSLLSRAEARALLVDPKNIEPDGTVWRTVLARKAGDGEAAERGRGTRGRWLLLEWAGGFAGALFLGVVSFWLLKNVGTAGAGFDPGPVAERFAIESVSIGGTPAQAYIYQPADTDMIFVWAEKSD